MQKVEAFLTYLLDKKYLKREDSISLKALVAVEKKNLEAEIASRKIDAGNLASDIFLEYFEDEFRDLRKAAGKKKFCVEVEEALKELSAENKTRILEAFKLQESAYLDSVETIVKEAYKNKIGSLPQVSILFTLLPRTAKPLFNEQSKFSEIVLNITRESVYTIKTVHLLFTISNVLRSYYTTASLCEKVVVCKNLYDRVGTADELSCLYELVFAYLADIQETFRRNLAFTTIKI